MSPDVDLDLLTPTPGLGRAERPPDGLLKEEVRWKDVDGREELSSKI